MSEKAEAMNAWGQRCLMVAAFNSRVSRLGIKFLDMQAFVYMTLTHQEAICHPPGLFPI
jgi:hypothetical protein